MTDDERYTQWKNRQNRVDAAADNDNRPVSVTVDSNGWRTEVRPDGSVKVTEPPVTPADMAAWQMRMDWSEAMSEDRRRTSQAFVASWQAAIVRREGNVTFFDPAFVWPDRGSRKVYGKDAY